MQERVCLTHNPGETQKPSQEGSSPARSPPVGPPSLRQIKQHTHPELPGPLQLTTHWVLNVRDTSSLTFTSASASKGGLGWPHLRARVFQVHISYLDNKKQSSQVETNCPPLQGTLVLTWMGTSSRFLPEILCLPNFLLAQQILNPHGLSPPPSRPSTCGAQHALGTVCWALLWTLEVKGDVFAKVLNTPPTSSCQNDA